MQHCRNQASEPAQKGCMRIYGNIVPVAAELWYSDKIVIVHTNHKSGPVDVPCAQTLGGTTAHHMKE